MIIPAKYIPVKSKYTCHITCCLSFICRLHLRVNVSYRTKGNQILNNYLSTSYKLPPITPIFLFETAIYIIRNVVQVYICTNPVIELDVGWQLTVTMHEIVIHKTCTSENVTNAHFAMIISG